MKRLISIILLTPLLLLINCSRGEALIKGTPQVVVSIPPYVYLVKEIVGDTMAVDSALYPNFDPHTAEATPSQMKLVQDADLFIGVGEGYERNLLRAIREGTKEVRILEMDEKIPLLSYSEDTNFIDACEDIHIPFSGSKDLHFWMGPKRLILQVEVLVEALVELKPHNSQIYQDNGETLIEKIKALDLKLEENLRLFQKKALLVSHASLGYFCYDYNIIQIAVECEGKSPLPQDLTRVLDLAENSDVICAFTGPQFNNKGVEMIAEKLKIRLESFDPLGEDILATLEKIGNDITK